MNIEPWIDVRLSKQEIRFLNNAIKDIKEGDLKKGNEKVNFQGDKVSIHTNNPTFYQYHGAPSRCKLIDKDNWFYETVLKKITERMFYRDWDNHLKYHIEKETQPPKFELEGLWVNSMKKYDHVPLHNHGCKYSFVVFIKIPTGWKKQVKWPKFLMTPKVESASSFQFVWTRKGEEYCNVTDVSLSPEDEGRMLFFPGELNHQVYPFYGTEEERITIGGNVGFLNPNRLKPHLLNEEPPNNLYEEKERMLKMMENSVKIIKEEMEMMKKHL